jgi:hypothetical protein
MRNPLFASHQFRLCLIFELFADTSKYAQIDKAFGMRTKRYRSILINEVVKQGRFLLEMGPGLIRSTSLHSLVLQSNCELIRNPEIGGYTELRIHIQQSLDESTR